MANSPNDKLAIAREYERIHLSDIDDAAQRGTEILMREIYTPKKDRIKKYADTLAERIDLKDPLLDITDPTQISGYIKRKYRELGVPESIINNINRELPEEYRRPYVKEEIENGDGTFAQMSDSSTEIKKLDNLRLQNEDEKLAEEEKELKAKLARVRDVRDIVHEEASERRLSLPSMRETVISTPTGEPMDTIYSNKLLEIASCFEELARKAVQFPPTPEDAARYASNADLWLEVLRPLTDLKFTKSTQGWLKTIRTYEDFGKHAAAVKEGVITPDGTKRPLTREQVGDKAPEVLDAAMKILDMEHVLADTAHWHRNYVEPPVGQRKENLNPKLSERA